MATSFRLGATLIVATALLFLTSCSSGNGSVADPAGTWGNSDPSAQEPYLEIGGEGSVGGSDGCNALQSNWTGDGQTITFSPMLLTTSNDCSGVDQWLNRAASAEIKDSTLIVHDAAGEQIGVLPRTAGEPQ